MLFGPVCAAAGARSVPPEGETSGAQPTASVATSTTTKTDRINGLHFGESSEPGLGTLDLALRTVARLTRAPSRIGASISFADEDRAARHLWDGSSESLGLPRPPR